MFYVYAYLDPRKPGQFSYSSLCFLYEPIYIGKGKNKRSTEHIRYLTRHRKSFFKDKLNKILMEVSQAELTSCIVLLRSGLQEQGALQLEKTLIREIGRADFNLGPLTNATDGGEGVRLKELSKEVRKKMSIAKTGVKNPNFGKNHSGECGPNAKLTSRRVHQIHMLLNLKIPKSEIAERYGIHVDTVKYIGAGKSWKSVYMQCRRGLR